MSSLSFSLTSFFLFIFLLESCAPVNRRRPINQSGPIKKVTDFNTIKKKIALLSFFNESNVGGDELAQLATQEFRRELAKSRDFIIDPEGEAIFGSSKEIYAGGGIKLAQLSRKAKMSGVNIVIFGRIKEARIRQKNDEIGFVRKVKSMAETFLEVKVFDVLNNKELYSETLDGNVADDNMKFFQEASEEDLAYRQELLRYSVKTAARKFLPHVIKVGTKLDWLGRVAKIIGTKMYINAGRESGINLGDILKVITEGQEVYDPESGAMIGMSQGEVKGTLEVVDFFGVDGAICILHSGGTVTEGDFVQLY